MIAGINVKEVMEEFGVCQSYAYKLKNLTCDWLNLISEHNENNCQCVRIDKRFIERTILSLALDASSPLEGIQRYMDANYGIHVSIGKISGIISKAADKAEEFDLSVNLDLIKKGANDEIFQGNKPVLTGIDLDSTYTYILEEVPDRTGDTWQTVMEYKKDQGLNLEVSVNDAGTGLINGIPKAFPDAVVQLDVFHALRDIGKEVSKLERAAYGAIKKAHDLVIRLTGPKPRKNTLEKLEKANAEIEPIVNQYDTIFILFVWLRELFGFSGYSFEETMTLTGWILDEMAIAAAGREKLMKEIKSLRKSLHGVLKFLKLLYKRFDELAEQMGVSPESFRLLYHLKTCTEGTIEYKSINKRIERLLGNKRSDAENALNEAIHDTKRASSIVENLNSRIRVYMNIKKVVPKKFFVLLKVYLNTRKYRRSRVNERKRKSPLELMTGQEHPDFYEIIGL